MDAHDSSALAMSTDSGAAKMKMRRAQSSNFEYEDSGGRRGGTDARQPPAKRARKAINCEPCRNSKLKCDRNRPCSSCVLRGTSAQCYQGSDSVPSHVESNRQQVDPLVEIARIRQSLVHLETHLKGAPGSHPPSPPVPPSASTSITPSPRSPRDHPVGRHSGDPSSSPFYQGAVGSSSLISMPGKLGRPGSGGLYAGPTSAAANMITNSDKEDSDCADPSPPADTDDSAFSPDSTQGSVGSSSSSTYDEDLIALLPSVEIVDDLVAYYFGYCNWVYRHVHEPALLSGWARFKAGQDGDRVVLGTVCVIIAIAIRYLPAGHALVSQLRGLPVELARKYHGVMRKALKRHREDAESLTRTYTLALVELRLVESHYLTFAKEDPEEVWSLGGELVSIGTAMGLHCDPGKTRYEPAVAERRRWAWWHIILFERWQAFMFGRPLRVASHHFDTQLPTYCDPALDKSGRLYLPNLALFRLAYILGDIMDDAVSFRAVPYSSVQEKDRLLDSWYEALPLDLCLDEFALARGLASADTAARRDAVQSVILRCASYHIRFTMHRPYVKVPASLDIAVNAASDLISLLCQALTAAPTPGHFNWGPFHVFSAAMFFSFQLITNPDQPGTGLFREQIRRALNLLERSRTLPVAEKSLKILQALEPLYSDALAADPPQERARRKSQVLKEVKTLAFPYQDPPYARNANSPSYRPFTPSVTVAGSSLGTADHQHRISLASASWAHSQAASSSSHYARVPSSFQPTLSQHSSTHQSSPGHIILPPLAHHIPQTLSSVRHTHPSDQLVEVPRNQRMSVQHTSVPSYPVLTMATYAMQQTTAMQQPLPHHAQTFEDDQSMACMHPADESSMWGASVGFGLGEWSRFLDVVHRPEASDGDR